MLRLKVAVAVPAVTITLTAPAVLPSVTCADARALPSVDELTFVNFTALAGEAAKETCALGSGFPKASVT